MPRTLSTSIPLASTPRLRLPAFRHPARDGAAVPAFQENGQFSLPRHEAVLKAQGYDPARVRESPAPDRPAIASAVAEGMVPVGRLMRCSLKSAPVSEACLPAKYSRAAVSQEMPRKFPADAERKALRNAGSAEGRVRGCSAMTPLPNNR